MAKISQTGRIYVLAGTNGAGKSSIIGAMFLEKGVEFFNPDVAAGRVLSANPGISQSEATSVAWHEGVRLLERALAESKDFAFETTLGGNTISNLLSRALSDGMEVRIWYVGLDSVEHHIARVQSRVKDGGHSIPEDRIRERYMRSRFNLIELLPQLAELLLYDNSEEADPKSDAMPKPKLMLHVINGKISKSCPLESVPEWAKPIFSAAIAANQ